MWSLQTWIYKLDKVFSKITSNERVCRRATRFIMGPTKLGGCQPDAKGRGKVCLIWHMLGVPRLVAVDRKTAFRKTYREYARGGWLVL